MHVNCKNLLIVAFVLVTLAVTGCAGGRVIEKTETDVTNYARILNHTLDERAKASSPLNNYPYADINLIWPLWSSDSSTNTRYYFEHSDITVTEGWFHIVYTCPNTIFVDSYGNETIVHLKAGHIYKLVCPLDSGYGSLEDQKP